MLKYYARHRFSLNENEKYVLDYILTYWETEKMIIFRELGIVRINTVFRPVPIKTPDCCRFCLNLGFTWYLFSNSCFDFLG
jgi:hypothetical protein